MAVTSTWRAALAVLDGPVGLVSQGQKIQLVQVVVCELSAAQCSSEDEEKVVDGEGAMRGPVSRRGAVAFELLPPADGVVAEEGIARDDVLAWVRERLPVSPTAPPKRSALSLLIGVIVCPKRACGLSPVNSILSIVIMIRI